MWKLSIDNGNVIEAIFIDFRKVFDSVDRNILGYKAIIPSASLRCNWGSLWDWLLSYLDNKLPSVCRN